MGYWRNLMRAAFAPPIRAIAGYEAAASTRRTQGWNPSSDGINALVSGGGDALRSRSRDMVRRNAWASNAVESFVGNCVGTGIKPQSRHLDAGVKRRLQELWLRWTDEADAAGLTDFYGLQALVCRSTVEAGECLVRIRERRPEDRPDGSAAAPAARSRTPADGRERESAQRQRRPRRDRVRQDQPPRGLSPLSRAPGREADVLQRRRDHARAGGLGPAHLQAAAPGPAPRPAVAHAGAGEAARTGPVRRRGTGPQEAGGHVRGVHHREQPGRPCDRQQARRGRNRTRAARRWPAWSRARW